MTGALNLSGNCERSIRSWPLENGISESAFYAWPRELRKQDHDHGLADRDGPGSFSNTEVAAGVTGADSADMGNNHDGDSKNDAGDEASARLKRQLSATIQTD